MEVDAERGAFGPVLRRLRREAGMLQEELAERAHLSAESISALERGRRRAPLPRDDSVDRRRAAALGRVTA
jgi:transcriptional regulator with XRE-family HTH domain